MPHRFESGPENLDNEEIERAHSVGLKAAIAASEHVLRYWPNPSNPSFDRERVMTLIDKQGQGTGNYATIADIESERMIIEAIKGDEMLAAHGILAEESEAEQSDSPWQWIIDPVDGTAPFKNGLPEFGISVGLLKDKEPVMGVIAMPALRQLITSRKGFGAKLMDFDGRELADLQAELPEVPLDKALVGYDLGYTNRGSQLSRHVARIADTIGYPVSYGSSSTANFRLALGQLGAYFSEAPTKYDIGAASAIIQEAGGIVTDMRGEPIDWSAEQSSYLAARTRAMHAKLLEMLNT